MSSSRSSSRYSNRSSTQSDPSSSADLSNVSYALARSKSTKNDQNLTAMVKKFMEKRSTKPRTREFVVAADVIADDFRKKASIRAGTTGGFGGLHKKLFGSKGKGDDKKKALTLTDVKPNARTLAMVLRSERELLSQNKDQETEIIDLKLMLEEKNREVDKLKDLCLKQREEIKALKNAILFPDVMLQDNQQEEVALKQAKQIIPSLQRQVTTLTGQLHSLAQDLAEVKADKYTGMGCYDSIVSSPRTPTHEQEEATNSLELSYTTPGSPDDMFLNDLNPCLTPFANSKSKSKEFENHSSLPNKNTTRCHDIGFNSDGRKLSKSSTNSDGRKLSKSSTGAQQQQHVVNSAKNLSRRSDENNRYPYRGW